MDILDFIHRRFPEDSHWTDGNCYYFALILSHRFALPIVYHHTVGHFLVRASSSDGVSLCYDHEGEHKIPDSELVDWDDLPNFDPLWYSHLVRDCID